MQIEINNLCPQNISKNGKYLTTLTNRKVTVKIYFFRLSR